MKELPLGIDIGATRLRIAQCIACDAGARVKSVVTRDIGEDVASSGFIKEPAYMAALLEEAWEELGTRQRNCVLAVSEPDAVFRMIELPPMTYLERERAAQYEAARFIDYALSDATIRLHTIVEGKRYALGIVRTEVLHSRIEVARLAKLRLRAVDYDGLALFRALRDFDAILDIGHERSSLHINQAGVPLTLQHVAGGAEITRGVRQDLGIDAVSAEKRKRILGTAGGGERSRETLVTDLASLLAAAAARHAKMRRVAVVGNASKLSGLCSDLERATGFLIEGAVSPILESPAYPRDVVRAAGPDWNLAAGLATWKNAA